LPVEGVLNPINWPGSHEADGSIPFSSTNFFKTRSCEGALSRRHPERKRAHSLQFYPAAGLLFDEGSSEQKTVCLRMTTRK